MFDWFRKRKRAKAIAAHRSEQSLMTALLALENTRLEQQVRLDQARAELELKRVQWETEHAEGIQKAKEADLRLREEIRERRKAAAAANREVRAKKIAERKNENGGSGECRVCKGGAVDLRAEEITWHYNGHGYGPSLFEK